MAEASGISVVIDDDDGGVSIDPASGSIATNQPDGGVVVQLDPRRKSSEDDEANEHFRNLVDDIDATELARIANELCDAISKDDESRKNSLAIRARGMDFLGLELKEPRANVGDSSAAVEGMATVTNPLLLDACLKGWANAQAELLPSEGPAKVEDSQTEASQAEEDLAEALERDFNHYLTVTATEYYPDTSHMLLWGVYFGGCGIKKVYRCPLRKRPVSESVDIKDFIVSDTTKDLRSCGRITHQIEMRPSVMKRMKLLGAYRDVPLGQPPTPTVGETEAKIASIQGVNPSIQRPEDHPYTLWETQCEIDLEEFAPGKFKGKGVPLPYLVTMDKDAREILAIRRDWHEDDEDCQRARLYIKYPYVPGPGFYGTGLLNILGNSSAAMTAAWREALDAGMFANFPSFIIAKLAGRQNTSDFRVSAGTGVPIDTGNMPINQVVANMPYRDVTPGLLSLIDKITAQAKEAGGMPDLPASEGIQNVPVGTMLAQIEQATKVMAAAHKGMHGAQAEELGLLADLFRMYPEDFSRLNKKCPPGFWTEQKLTQALNDCNLVPRSDPNTPSHIHRVAKAVGLVQLATNPMLAPFFSVKEMLTRVLRVIREDPEGLLVDPQPMAGGAPAGPTTDPLIGQARMLSAQAQMQGNQVKAQDNQAKLGIDQEKLQISRETASANLAKEMIIHQRDAAVEERARLHDQAMEAKSQAADQGHQAHERAMAQGGLALEGQQQAHDQTMDVAQHGLAEKQHELEVYQAKHPPKPASPTGKKK